MKQAQIAIGPSPRSSKEVGEIGGASAHTRSHARNETDDADETNETEEKKDETEEKARSGGEEGGGGGERNPFAFCVQ